MDVAPSPVIAMEVYECAKKARLYTAGACMYGMLARTHARLMSESQSSVFGTKGVVRWTVPSGKRAILLSHLALYLATDGRLRSSRPWAD